jgi:hypothetical protein
MKGCLLDAWYSRTRREGPASGTREAIEFFD